MSKLRILLYRAMVFIDTLGIWAIIGLFLLFIVWALIGLYEYAAYNKEPFDRTMLILALIAIIIVINHWTVLSIERRTREFNRNIDDCIRRMGGGSEPLTILKDSNKKWPKNAWSDCFISITSGAASGSVRKIIGNSDSELFMSTPLSRDPRPGDQYMITSILGVPQKCESGFISHIGKEDY